jgi:hypothetical protein
MQYLNNYKHTQVTQVMLNQHSRDLMSNTQITSQQLQCTNDTLSNEQTFPWIKPGETSWKTSQETTMP